MKLKVKPASSQDKSTEYESSNQATKGLNVAKKERTHNYLSSLSHFIDKWGRASGK
jgi:hypothetical protein